MTAFIVLAALLWFGALAAIAVDAWLDMPTVDEHVHKALTMPLPAPDATDAAFEQWVREALDIANTTTFEADVLADIEAITRGESA